MQLQNVPFNLQHSREQIDRDFSVDLKKKKLI